MLVLPRHSSHALRRTPCRSSLPWILDAGAVEEAASLPWAYIVRAVAASAAFLPNWSVSKVLEAATWRSNPVLLCFTYVIYRIHWITAILSGLLLQQVLFYLSTGFAFSSFFHVFLFCCFVSEVIFTFIWVLLFSPFGTCLLPGIGLSLGSTYD